MPQLHGLVSNKMYFNISGEIKKLPSDIEDVSSSVSKLPIDNEDVSSLTTPGISVPPLYNENDYPEDLLPSQKRKRHEIVLNDKIFNASSEKEVFGLLKTYKDFVEGSHVNSALLKLSKLVSFG